MCKITIFVMLLSVFLMSCFAQASVSENNEYTLKDLSILAKDKSYEEFFLHARDVRPIARGHEWQKMVQNMAENYTESLLELKLIEKKNISTIENLLSWPILHDSEFFLRNRGRIALKYFEQCYKSELAKDRCSKEITTFWQKEQRDPELGMKLGAILQTYDSISPELLWGFYSSAATSNFAEFYCKKPEMKSVVFDKLWPIAANTEKSKLASEIYNVFHKDCLKAMLPFLKNALWNNTWTTRSYAYEVLSAIGELKSTDKDLYLLSYIMTSPDRGETMNNAWRAVEELGRSSSRREAMLERIRDLDPLPDEILANRDKHKMEIILRHVHKNIPEYLDLYSRTCLDYLEGKANFANGNPTVRCKELFKISKGTTLVEASLHKRFESLPQY